MKRILLVVLALLLTACGGGGDSNCVYNPGGSSQTIVGTTGLTLAPSQGMYISFQQMEGIYAEVEACVGVKPAAGPTVFFKSFSKNNLGAAWAFQTSNVIWVNTDTTNNRNCHSDQSALRHEFVHYLLYMSGASVVDNGYHGSIYFQKCNAMGVNTNNGIPY